jgi:para-aminobenzoate synthetase/4-amino-4-deoxychorismate lyase
MGIIRSLEPEPRGVYCGAIGLVGPPDAPVSACFNVAIRTAVWDTFSGEALYGTGGGITWGSEPAAEHDEVLAKAAVLAVQPRGFELLETMWHDPQRGLRNRDRHLQRLAASAEHLAFRFDESEARRLLDARLAREPPARVRLRLRRDGTLTVDVAALPSLPAGPVLLAVDDEPADPEARWLRHKTCMREHYDRRRHRRPDVDDVIMANTRGELTEVTRATLAVQIDGQWWTPPVESGCLPGVERARLIGVGRLRERVLHVADLERAEGVAVLSSLRGRRAADLSPVRREGAPTPRPRPAGVDVFSAGSAVPAVLVGKGQGAAPAR